MKVGSVGASTYSLWAGEGGGGPPFRPGDPACAPSPAVSSVELREVMAALVVSMQTQHPLGELQATIRAAFAPLEEALERFREAERRAFGGA